MTSEHLTLAEMLQAEGYWTGAWVGRQYYSFIGASRGFAQGFDHYAHAPHGSRARTGSSTPLHGRRADQTIGKGRTQISALLRWLAGPMPEPFFLFVHLDDVHSQPTGAP